jgi:NADPH:quinone reductase-like Zn-dependent oxidoreductase
MNDWFADGAMAEFCIAHHSAVARKPAVLSHTEAASVPIGALTAAQGLFDRAKLRAGESVLVHGGSGAVGVFAVQLAKLHGGRVIATASGRNLEFVTRLGAERVVDYRERRWETALPRVDVVFDTAGGETLDRSWAMLKPHGRIVTVAASAENATKERVKKAFFIVEPDGKRLAETGELVSAGRLKPVVDAVFPLDQAPEVFAERVVRHGRGKLVIAVQECDG